MIVSRLELVDFRNYESALFELTEGTTAVLGKNGQGKTNFAEALAYLATLSSFRGAPGEALVRAGASAAIVRATVAHDDGRTSLIETEIVTGGRNRVQVNKQRLNRTRDLLGTLRVSVFSPDDLVVVKAGPGERRRFMDDTLVALAVKYDSIRLDIDRIVRQRNTLLKQAGPKRTGASRSSTSSSGTNGSGGGDGDIPDIDVSLDVWDMKFAAVADQFGYARATLIERLQPLVSDAYEQLAGEPTHVELRYVAPWRESGLEAALRTVRADDLRRQTTTVGPHRDDVEITLAGLPARTHASQGEQRTLALALRLAAHRLVAERTGTPPVLVLDDVLSELDADRSTALLSHLPPGQVVITSASELPPAAHADRVLRIDAGTVLGDAHDVAG